jgi:curved DNA-binding protein CbpA
VSEVKLVDYYSILNVPTTADLVGIENAYARLSSDLMDRAEIDETYAEELSRLNEAFAVLGKPNLRADYDAVLFHDEIRARSRRQRSLERRRKLAANLIVGSVLLIVLAQVAVLGYMAVDRFPALLDRF